MDRKIIPEQFLYCSGKCFIIRITKKMNEMMQEAQRMKLTSLLERLEYEVRQGSDEI